MRQATGNDARNFVVRGFKETDDTPATTGVHKFTDENPITGLCDICGSSVQFHTTTGVHTATPFGEVPCSLERNGKGNGNSFELLNEAGFPIARIYDEERAAFILRAVNSHDKLVAALKAVKEELELSMMTANKDAVLTIARAALAEAEK